VTEKLREIDHESGSHGAPGIFFKYDVSPIRVKVNLVNKSLFELVVPLIGIVGGIFSTSSMLNALYQSFRDFIKAK
jgi:endoplasmic reticulum-Golgi intermediate compartment protein 2